MGPYRARILPSLDLEQFWRYLRKRRGRRRMLGALLCATGLGGTALFAGAVVHAGQETEPTLVSNQLPAWGLRMTASGASAHCCSVPQRADPDRSMDFGRVQEAVERALPALEKCHRAHAALARSAADRWLFVEVLLLGRQLPQVHVRANSSAEMAGLSRCVDWVFSTQIDFPAPTDRAALVTYPILLPSRGGSSTRR